MNHAVNLITLIQFFFAIVIGLYFWNLLRSQQGNRVAVNRESKKEMEKLYHLRQLSLTEPLSEKTRPVSFQEVIGQTEGVKALKAALCGPNPQHILIFGPPGIGKTAAARLVLEKARLNPHSPFSEQSKFVELDATTARFDDRGIADPLIGSVHDPIYQGAGAMGVAGIPQPKPGAVTKAHGGMLFIDEIGELHPIQMNKLLKVLEDRKVFLESAYYNDEDYNIPQHIHEIFQKGLPADFRLVGATTRNPQEIPPALRSRCLEVFFRSLNPEEVWTIAKNAVEKIGLGVTEKGLDIIARYASSGREAVNMVQTAGGIALEAQRQEILEEDIEWVINSGHYVPRPEKRIGDKPMVGFVNGLAVLGPNQGLLIEVEVSTYPVSKGEGRIILTGVIEEEEMGDGGGRRVRRRGMAKDSVENVTTLLRQIMDVNPRDFDIHVNFPGGIPIDGPSAGVTIATAIYSSLTGRKVDNQLAMTGEISIRGLVKPVGGVVAKIQAAQRSGATRVIIPAECWQALFSSYTQIEIIPVTTLKEVLALSFVEEMPVKTPALVNNRASLQI